MRVGIVMACVPGVPWALFTLVVGVLAFLAGGDAPDALHDLRDTGLLLGGSLVAGVLMGLVIGGGLALASRAITRTWGLALVGAVLASVVYVPEFVVVAVGTDGGYAELGTTLLAWPGMVVVAAVHSSDIAGLTRKRAWLWSSGLAQRWSQRRARPMPDAAGNHGE